MHSLNPRHALILLLLLAGTVPGKAQQPTVDELVKTAIPLMDEGQYDESRQLLNQARKIDPDNWFVNYELGYSYILENNYAAAVKPLKKAAKSSEANYQPLAMLGSVYDYMGKPKKATKTYLKGRKQFTDEAQFNVELGITEFRQGNFDAAVAYWEDGIHIDPNNSSNYYHLANLFGQTETHLWTVIYGEQFILLEPGSKRTEAVSQLVLEAYNKAITLEGDSATVSFIRQHNLVMDPDNVTDFQLPSTMIFGVKMSVATAAIAGESEINTQTLHPLRDAFLDAWDAESRQNYPNHYFEWLYQLREAGHLEAFDNWLISMGDEVGFEMWMANNPSRWRAFIDYMDDSGYTVPKGKEVTRQSF